MSFRNSYTFTKNFLILNVDQTSIRHPREKHIVDEYKKIHAEKEKIDKDLDVLVYTKKTNLLTILRIKVLQYRRKKKHQQLRSIENSPVLSDLIQREQSRRMTIKLAEERERELEAVEEATHIIAHSPIVLHNDDYFEQLWKNSHSDFWKEVKLEWRAKNPGKTETDSGIPFEKRCQYLSWVLSVSSNWTISNMRQKLISTNKEDASTMCVFDVIDRYNYHFPMVK